MTIHNLLHKWQDTQFASSTTVTPEFAAFARDFRTTLRQSLTPIWELTTFHRGHFECSGFLRHSATDQYIYWSIHDVRLFPGRWWSTHILIRNARDSTDSVGGPNHYTNLIDFPRAIQALMTLAPIKD